MRWFAPIVPASGSEIHFHACSETARDVFALRYKIGTIQLEALSP
jgi:hypothetical protein